MSAGVSLWWPCFCRMCGAELPDDAVAEKHWNDNHTDADLARLEYFDRQIRLALG